MSENPLSRVITITRKASQVFYEAAIKKDAQAAENARRRYLGRKGGELTKETRGLKDLSADEKRIVGPVANSATQFVVTCSSSIQENDQGKTAQAFFDMGERFQNTQIDDKILSEELKQAEEELKQRASEILGAGDVAAISRSQLDLTIPGRPPLIGHEHPLVQTMEDLIEVLTRLGYSVAEGPEAELDYYNFEALNIPKDHPARDMQDTFYLSGDALLRTHTSPVQIRVMENQEPPVKVIAPGKVFRCDADVTHSPMFHQIEGLYVDEGVTFADLKGTLEAFVREIFGPEYRVRLRPSFFPFTEPSVEVDIASDYVAGGEWMEVLGAGMVDPAVFEAVGYDPERWTGFAWGLGVERITMLRYGISDIRLFFENDLRMLRQF